MKKGTITLFFCLLLTSMAYSQKLSDIIIGNNGTTWVNFKPTISVKATQLFKNYQKAFGIGSADDMRLLKTETDKFGFTHYRYQQFHNGVAVDGAIYLLHEKNNQLKTGNGLIVETINASANPAIQPKKAIENAIAMVSAEKYAWQDQMLESDLKSSLKNQKATHYPTASLMYYSKNNAHDYHLVYRVEVLSVKPLKRMAVFVDAQNGAVYHSVNMLMNIDKPTIAETRYNGIKQITVDSVSASQYYLRETGRGGGITTKNLQNQGDMVNVNTNLAVQILEADSFFNEDLAANSAHWASEMTYDYYQQVHGRNSYDNNGAAMFSYVHWGNGIANAMWTGSAMVYGDGDGSTGPFTTAEICGHEITHAVTQYTANLNYENESGGLNEAFSDIFGSMVNFFATDTINWLIGLQTGSAFRNMHNPKQYQNPDTYKGQYWYAGTSDNGGVHTNSGVANYWFSLIVSGDTGTNDIGYHYNVIPIGPQKSQLIAYRALSTYLTPTSQYIDAYQATVHAANDIYGECSTEAQTVAAAWAAVGVGRPFDTLAVYSTEITGPDTDCGLSNESLSIKLLYNGCNRQLNVGTKIFILAKVDQTTLYYDTITLSVPFEGGTILPHTLASTINVSAIGNHRIDLWVKSEGALAYTDSIKNYQFTNRLLQNVDFSPTALLSPATSCHLGTQETVSMTYTYLGCAPILIGDSIRLAYKANSSDTVFEYKHLTQPMNYGDTLSFTFNTKADCSLPGNNVITLFTVNPTDTFRLNNTQINTIVRPQFANTHGLFTFSETDVNDYFYKEIVQYGKVRLKAIAGSPNGKVLNLTGGNVFSYYDQLSMPTPGQEWNVNEMLSAKASFCLDARTLTYLHVGFDLKQTSGGDLYTQYLGPGDYSSSSIMRILVNGQHVGNQTYKPSSTSADPYTNHVVSLSSYVGDILEVSFETRNIASDTLVFTLDNAFIDNLVFIENSGDNIEENNSRLNVSIYPNPANEQTNIQISSNELMTANLQICDFMGKLLVAKPVLINSGDNIINLDLKGFANGMYLIKIQTLHGAINRKVLINK